MALNWDDMRIFLAVAREGNLSAAARALKVTQPTVGRRLKAVEERLATRLFDRLPDGFAPTASGAALLPLAEEMERAAEAVERRQASLADAVSALIDEGCDTFFVATMGEARAARHAVQGATRRSPPRATSVPCSACWPRAAAAGPRTVIVGAKNLEGFLRLPENASGLCQLRSLQAIGQGNAAFYPVFHRDPTMSERLVPWLRAPNERPGAPVGMPVEDLG